MTAQSAFRMPQSVRAILFDAGGTLFRVRGSVGEAYAVIAAQHGVSVLAEDIEQRFRSVFPRLPPLCFPGVPDDQLARSEYTWWRDVVHAVFDGIRFADFEAFFEALFGHFAQAEAWELFPDTQPVLAALKARGLQLAVVSNFDGRLAGICEGLGIARSFDAIVMSGRVGYAKPDPRIFAIALQRLGVGPGAAVHVGDSEREDVVGAQAADMRAVLVDRSAAAGALDGRIRDLRELIALL